MSRRAVVIVLDACGVGALPDADDYGDGDASTLTHLAEAAGGLALPTLERLGMGCVAEVKGLACSETPVLHGRLHPLGGGKDSTTGHWELMGVSVRAGLPTYTEGVPEEIVSRLAEATGRPVIGNAHHNGVEAIERYGIEALERGALVLYTSEDSVVQFAAHVDAVSADELYAACDTSRRLFDGEHAVGRVIARPFEGPAGGFTRTLGRRDYALPPPARSYLDELRDDGVAVHAVGKVAELFAGAGIGQAHRGASNAEAIESTGALLRELDGGLVFGNLIETDQVYGHRKDVPGFAAALEGIDAAVAQWLELMRPGDLLVLTADHGCDVTTPGTDHTREYAPLLAVFDGHGGRRHDGPLADVGASVLRWVAGRDAPGLPGEPFV
jgi:phosphopentomutase